MEIKTSEFVKSSDKLENCPDRNFDEIAVTGRSNVGKSTFINMLLQRKNLAHTSGKPGKTRLINHFIINESWYFVDLPGYGYARVSKKERGRLGKLITDYVNQSENLQCLLVLVDISIEPHSVDLEIIEQLGINEIPFAIIFTKSDKLSNNQLQKNLSNYKKILNEKFEFLPYWFVTSGAKGTGREDLLEFIDKVLNKKLPVY